MLFTWSFRLADQTGLVDEAGWYLEVMRFFEREAASIEAARIVPACPGWDVHDLVAHQVHQLSSASDGSFPVQDSVDAMVAVEVGERQAARARQDQWTAEGVRARRETPVAVLIAELRRLAAEAPAAALSALFPDVAVHLFDLLGAGGSSAYRDHAFVVPALRFWNSFAEKRLQQAGQGPIRPISGRGRGDRAHRCTRRGCRDCLRTVACDRRTAQPPASRRVAVGWRR
jgi:hypothetical protein